MDTTIPTENLTYSQKWYLNNLEYYRSYREKNKEKIHAYRVKYVEEHKEELKKYHKKYYRIWSQNRKEKEYLAKVEKFKDFLTPTCKNT